MYNIGDRVKVTFEGRITFINTYDRIDVETDTGSDIEYIPTDSEDITIEVIKPPAVSFVPGDRLRRKHTDDPWLSPHEVTLADRGYIVHNQYGNEYIGTDWSSMSKHDFTTDNYEKVN